MIALKKYSEDFEEIYFKKVEQAIDNELRIQILESCKKYFPEEFFHGVENEFRALILSPYKELKKVYNYINKNTFSDMQSECFVKEKAEEKEKLKDIYQKLYDSYNSITGYYFKKIKINVLIVKESKILTCPYCNRDYINCRGNSVSGAQLDHFYSRSKYPIFSACLYNLVPVCGNCNRVKSDSTADIISPFDDSIVSNNCVEFKYEFDSCRRIVLDIEGTNGLENNISTMKIKDAYEIHKIDVEELIEKAKIYNKTQVQEIIDTLLKLDPTFSKSEFKKLIFGIPINPEEFGKIPLSKLKHDILKNLEITF